MKLPVWLLLALTLLLGILGDGCTPSTFVVQQYGGPQRAPDTIAIIRMNGKDPVGIDSLDGETVGARAPEDARIHVEVLPGRHKLVVRNLENPEVAPAVVSFVAEAGRVYRPGFAGYGAHVYEVDPDTDAVARDVTAVEQEPMVQPPAAKPPPSPPPPPPVPPAPIASDDAGSSGDAAVD